ncbi:hypothetical protein FSB73_03995 [Arachidicoccus ginsenosidivorans]|uniref:Uncharacterized protein n=1 Tax=Arachidicoccus ginsenosidivorans TaxID=496057 RepID=A0A5B8VI49_9BACT|nr:hypothetical protein [Arachidicoccus ginsenosidivorans]QEC70969.1 hypothetical protein FSB73_03995 [Arachidicoccus ginsenosidivorans]
MKKNIALVTGGFTGESVISYQSAENVRNNLDLTLFNVYTIDIRQDDWTYTDKQGQIQSVNKADFSILEGSGKVRFDKVFYVSTVVRGKMVVFRPILSSLVCPLLAAAAP